MAWMSVTQGWLFILHFGVSVVVARLLSPYDMGVFAVATSIVALLSVIRYMGMYAYLLRASHLDHKVISTAPRY